MDLLDGTIVNVAAPSIRADLGASLSALQWIAGGYALTFAIGLVTGGRLGDIYGRRRLFLIGVAGFTASSALCGLATSPELLIGFRLLQGGFAAVMIPQGFGILREVFPPGEIQKAFGLFGPVIGLSAVLGPVLGGVLTDGVGWRAIFLVNLPLGLAALAGASRLLPESKAQQRPALDVAGAVLVSLATGLVVYPLIQGREAGWPAWTFAALAAGLLGPRFGRPTLHGGLVVMLAGVLGMLLTAGDDASAWALAGPELAAGVGMGALLAPLFDFVLAGVDDDEVGSASGVLNAMQQLGGAIGIAVIGTIFFSIAASRGLTGAFHTALWIEAGVLVVTAALVLLPPKRAREEAHA